MNGRQPIVLMLRNHGFREHASLDAAKTEAERLAEAYGGECVVYVPISLTCPPRRMTTEPLPLPAELRPKYDDDLPF